MTRRCARCSLWLLLAAPSWTACNSFGPSQIDDGHLLYNAAVKDAADTEILLNIVRLRYLDTIEFMSANSISAQSSFSTSVGGQFGASGFAKDVTQAIIIPEVRYSNTPTFTFTPQRGESFARRLLEPVQVEILVHLASSAWDVEILMRLLVSEVNGIANDIGRPNPEFNGMAGSLERLVATGELVFGFVEESELVSSPVPAASITAGDIVDAASAGFQFEATDDGTGYVLTRARNQPVIGFRNDSDVSSGLRRALDLAEPPDGRPYYPIHSGRDLDDDEAPEEHIAVRTRSLLDALLYLAGGVQVPEAHLEAGLVEEDWAQLDGAQVVSEGFFTVQSSRSKPDAHLAVQHRGYWFFIADSDLASRGSFLQLAELFRLQLWESKDSDSPVLTLPVSG